MNLHGYDSYFEALLFANELDSYSFDDLDLESVARQINQLDEFFKESQSILDDSDYTHDQACHDFFFTRCRHGVGFWEGDHCDDEQGKKLTDIAHSYGDVYVYVENGKVYID